MHHNSNYKGCLGAPALHLKNFPFISIPVPGWYQSDTRVIPGVHLGAPALHLKNFPFISIRYQGDTRVIPGWYHGDIRCSPRCTCLASEKFPFISIRYQGDTRVIPGWYQGDTRVIPGWYQGDTRCLPWCTCIASEKFPFHINTVVLTILVTFTSEWCHQLLVTSQDKSLTHNFQKQQKTL